MRVTLNLNGRTPAYQQIETQLAELIERGDLGAGDRLPPERDLAADLGVSRMTVRQAFDALARRGLIERGVGRGTFVAVPKVEMDRTHRVAGFSEQMESAGLEPAARVVVAEVRPAPAAVAAALQIDPGAPAVHVERVRSAGRVALTLEDSWLPDALFPGLAEQDLSGSVYALMHDRYDRAPVRAIEHLEPVAARAMDARALGVRAGSPLMLVERVAFDAGGTPVEFARDRHRGDRARFVVEVAPRG